MQALQGHLDPCDDSTENSASKELVEISEEVLVWVVSFDQFITPLLKCRLSKFTLFQVMTQLKL